MMEVKKSKRCLFPGCNCKGKKRKNCPKHYQLHLRKVNAGETTWTELEDLGLVSKPAPGHRSDDYQHTLNRARSKAGGSK